jgi:pentatricopeptide repeat protein
MEANKLSFERLYKRLCLHKGNAFFFVTCESMAYQREIVSNLRDGLGEDEAKIFDFYNVGTDFIFSSAFLHSLVDEKTKVLFLVNFQMATAKLPEAEFFQILNLSRDSLAKIPCAIVFLMPLYFRTSLARNAPDFNSFVRFRVNFETEPVDKANAMQAISAVDYEYNEANKKLFDYHKSMYNSDDESFEAFELVVNLLNMNRDLRLLHYTELNYFHGVFDRLLHKYENEAHSMGHKIAWILEGKGDYQGALLWLKNSYATCKNTFGDNDPKTADIIHGIAFIYAELCDYQNALEWYQKALHIYEKVLGLEHPDTAATYNNIARVYGKQGDYSKALEWYRKALDIKEKVLGLEHPNTATTYSNIAGVYAEQGDYPKALEWYHKALRIDEKVLGADHPLTATTYSNIAFVYEEQGDYPKALEWYHKALRIREKTLGLEHPNTIKSNNSTKRIESLLSLQAKYTTAMEAYPKAEALETDGDSDSE